MRPTTILPFLLICLHLVSYAQQRYVNFNGAIPSNWSTNSSTPLSLNNEHYKDGTQSLKWTAAKGNLLKAINLAIPQTEVASTSTGSAQIFIYSTEVSQDTLLFQFFDNDGTKRREGRMLLNFKGWREYHRSYYYDYNNGNTLTAFPLNQCIITYKPQSAGSIRSIYLDAVKFIGDSEIRTPGPHMALDYHHFKKNVVNSQYPNAFESWKNTPDISITPPNEDEVTGLQIIRSRFQTPIGTVSSANLKTAKDYVTYAAISRSPDNSLKGRGLLNLHDADTLALMSTYCGYLAKAYINNSDNDAGNKLLLFTEYLIDQGLAEGGRNALRTNYYNAARDFPLGFIDALKTGIYPQNLRNEVIKMLKWSHQFNIIYETDFLAGYNVDFLNLKSKALFDIALLQPDDAAVRDIKCIKRFMERNTIPALGARDGMKPDGVGYHHQSHHVSYMTAWGVWIDLVQKLTGTVFRINQTAYNNMSLGIKSLFLATSKGTVFSQAESGRTPFQSSVPVSLANFRKLVEIGGDIKGTSADPDMAAFYNYITGTNTFSVTETSFDGFYSFNYGAMAVHRKKNWTAVIRGFTNKIFGSEIYVEDNRWGRYQSYGSLEFLYGGSLAASGYINIGNGWDWNVMPGTTTVHFPDFTGLRPSQATATEFQTGTFAGGLSLGDNGVFGMDFSQNAQSNYTTSNLKFKKSVFAFDDFLVCLGSNISTSNSLGNVATNLFQAITTNSNPAIYINSATPFTGTYNSSLSTEASGIWILNSQKTGYYIPKGNGGVSIYRGSQSTPLESSNEVNQTASANASKAWINHGTQPNNGNYQFVAVPDITPSNMQNMVSKFEDGSLYKVLMQTDAVHAVSYLPKKLTAYVFFKAQTDVNIGFVKSISNKALVGIRQGLNTTTHTDSLIVTINCPDLNTQDKSSFDYYWLARPTTVTLTLNGDWSIAENPSLASIDTQNGLVTATFVLENGFSQTIKLTRLATSDSPGEWVGQSNDFNYDLGTQTGTQGNSLTTPGYSISHSASPGFLPYPTQGYARTGIGSSGNARFDLLNTETPAALKMTASSAGAVGKFSLYETGSSPVTALFFKMSFNNLPNNGVWTLAIGNHAGGSTLFNNGTGILTAIQEELFTSLNWTIGSGNTISLANRTKSGSTITNTTIPNASFVKGGTYQVELYCNNSANTQKYIRNTQEYSSPTRSFDIWVDGIRLGNFASAELTSDKPLNALLFTGNNNSLPIGNSAELTLSNIALRYIKPDVLPLQVTSFTARKHEEAVMLNWKTVAEKNVDFFRIYRSTDTQKYLTIGIPTAKGNTNEETIYSFIDNNLPNYSSNIYYKIEAVDKDGTVSYSSNIIAINFPDIEKGVKLFPNPASEKIELTLSSTNTEQAQITINGIDGKLYHSTSYMLAPGVNTFLLNISNLPAGTYLVNINSPSTKVKRLFIKI